MGGSCFLSPICESLGRARGLYVGGVSIRTPTYLSIYLSPAGKVSGTRGHRSQSAEAKLLENRRWLGWWNPLALLSFRPYTLSSSPPPMMCHCVRHVSLDNKYGRSVQNDTLVTITLEGWHRALCRHTGRAVRQEEIDGERESPKVLTEVSEVRHDTVSSPQG